MRHQILLRDINIRLVIFFIAFFIWFHAVTERQYEAVFQVDVVPVNVPENYVISQQFTQSVDVLFRGTGKTLLQALMNRKIEIFADIGNRKNSRITVNLDLKDLNIDGTALQMEPVALISPDTASITQERIRVAKVPLISDISIIPVPGYTVVGGIQLDPDTVTITGPEKTIAMIKSLKTVRAEFDDISADVSGSIQLQNPDPIRIAADLSEVVFSADVQQLSEKDLIDIPVSLVNIPSSVRASVLPSTLSLKIKGGFELLESIGRNDISAFIDYHQYESSGELALLPSFKTPDEITIFGVFPEKIELIIK